MSTEVTDLQVVNSTIDNTTIGATTPVTGAFTVLSAGNINGGAGGNVITVQPTSGATNDFVVKAAAGSNNFIVEDNGTLIANGPLAIGAGGISSSGTIAANGGLTAPAATVTNVIVGASGLTSSGPVTLNGSAALNGAATAALTPSSADNSTNIINSAWAKVGFSVSLAANGFIKFPTWLGGLVLQWGAANAAASSQAVSFPTAFPTAAWIVNCVPVNFGPNAGRSTPYIDALSTTGFTQTSAGSTNSIFWFAIGH